MQRREFLQCAFAGMLGALGQERTGDLADDPLPPVPRVNGGINVAPLRRFDLDAGATPPLILPELVDLQMKLVYELGFQQMRIMISFERFGPNFLAAIPYVRAARALGIDVLGILDQFAGFDLLRALSRRETRDEVLEAYVRIFGDAVLPASETIERAGDFAIQVLNEPTHFFGIPPDVYVRDFLRPAYLHLKEDDPGLTVVSAAPVSSAEGFLRARTMLETGLEHVCDRVAYHVYGRRLLDRLSGLTVKPIWITETGIEGTERHLDWMTATYGEIREKLPRVERIFWFDLFDAIPRGFRLVSIEPQPFGRAIAFAESVAVIEWLSERVREASGGGVLAPYDSLIRDIALYFPTDEDRRILEATSFWARL